MPGKQIVTCPSGQFCTKRPARWIFLGTQSTRSLLPLRPAPLHGVARPYPSDADAPLSSRHEATKRRSFSTSAFPTAPTPWAQRRHPLCVPSGFRPRGEAVVVLPRPIPVVASSPILLAGDVGLARPRGRPLASSRFIRCLRKGSLEFFFFLISSCFYSLTTDRSYARSQIGEFVPAQHFTSYESTRNVTKSRH